MQSLHVPLVKQRLGTLLCTLLSCTLAGPRSSPSPSCVSPPPRPAPTPHDSAPSPAERASSSGRWCAGPAPTAWGSVRGTSRTRSRPAACPPAEVSRAGWGLASFRSDWPRPEAQPDWLPSPLVPPSTSASSSPLPGNLQNSTVKADARELVTPEGQWMPQSGPVDPINKISSSKYISGPYPFPSLPVSGITSMGHAVEQTLLPVCPYDLSLLR